MLGKVRKGVTGAGEGDMRDKDPRERRGCDGVREGGRGRVLVLRLNERHSMRGFVVLCHYVHGRIIIALV